MGGGEGREKESVMHWGLLEESTEGLMDLLASLLEVSVAGQVQEAPHWSRPAWERLKGRFLEVKRVHFAGLCLTPFVGKAGYEARGVMQILRLHQMQHPRLTWELWCCLAVFVQGLWSSGLPQSQGKLPTSAQMRHDLTPQSNPTSPGQDQGTKSRCGPPTSLSELGDGWHGEKPGSKCLLLCFSRLFLEHQHTFSLSLLPYSLPACPSIPRLEDGET